MILEFVFEVDIIWTHFLHILDNVNGNHSFTLFPFYLINIFITKLLEKRIALLPRVTSRSFLTFCMQAAEPQPYCFSYAQRFHIYRSAHTCHSAVWFVQCIRRVHDQPACGRSHCSPRVG